MNRINTVFVSFLLLLVAFLVSPAVVGASNSGDDWRMYRHDPSHTAHTTGGAPTYGYPIWAFETEGAITSSPAVFENKVYIASLDGNLYAIDAKDGSEIWSRSIGKRRHIIIGITMGEQLLSSPAVEDGRVYVGSWENKLYAFDADSGKKLWTFQTGGRIDSSPTVANGAVYVGSRDNKLYALNAANGGKLWSFPTGDIVTSSPAVYGGKVFIGSRDGYLYALDADSGTEKWSFEAQDLIHSSPAVADNRVYFGSRDAHVYALDAETGENLWSFPIPPLEGKEFVNSSPAVWKGTVYISSYNYRVYALDAVTGDVKWSFKTNYRAGYSSPAVADGLVYIGSYDGNYYALDAENGSKIWSFGTLGKDPNDFGYVISSPAIADNRVYVGSSVWERDDSHLYALGSPLEIKVENLVLYGKKIATVRKENMESILPRSVIDAYGSLGRLNGIYALQVILFVLGVLLLLLILRGGIHLDVRGATMLIVMAFCAFLAFAPSIQVQRTKIVHVQSLESTKKVRLGESVKVSAVVNNLTKFEGVRTIVLTVFRSPVLGIGELGVEVETKQLTFRPNESKSVEFTLHIDEEGSFHVRLGDESERLQVTSQ